MIIINTVDITFQLSINMSYISSQTDYCKIVLFYACLFNLERENIIFNFGDINFWFSTARRFGKANEWSDFLDRPVILD